MPRRQTKQHRSGVDTYLGPAFGLNPLARRNASRPPAHAPGPLARLRDWNGIAVDASGLDHTPPAAGEARTFGEQLGPTRASRAMAIVHIAMFDAVNAIAGKYQSFSQGVTAAPGASMEAAIAQAAHDTLVALFPSFPSFPSYRSGHAGFGGALFQTLARFYGRDDIAFSFTSDEFNGITLDSNGDVRPIVTRTFRTLSDAEEENGQSRIYLGIHWHFDKTAGIDQGRRVADYVFDRAFQPLHDRGH